MNEQTTENIKDKTDWTFLFFLFLFTNQSNISLKILGLVFIYFARPDFQFKVSKGLIPKFYLYILIYSAFCYLFITREYTYNYTIAFLFGNMFWFFGLLAFHQLRLSVEKFGPRGVYQTLKVFTILNFLFSIYYLVVIIGITGKLNPYEGLDFPYGMSTGDNIYGIFMGKSYYNMMISAMLAVYFLFKRNIPLSLLAMSSLILVFGNVGTLIFAAALLGMLAIGITNDVLKLKLNAFTKWIGQIIPPGNYKLYIPVILISLTIVYTLLSPPNTKYLEAKLKSQVFTVNDADKNSYGAMIENQVPDPVAYDPYKTYTEKEENTGALKDYYNNITVSKGSPDQNKEYKKQITKDYIEQLEGKALSLLETKQYLLSSPKAFLFGAGTGRFSSQTAQKMAGYDSSRLFMNILPHYSSPLYDENHKLIVDIRYKSSSEYFSNANWPDSFYNQIASEYGVLGIILFLLFYVFYFVKDIRYWSYGTWISIMLLFFFSLSYMFESLCIIVLFEYLMVSDIQEGKNLVNEP